MKTKIQTIKTFSELTKDEAEKYFSKNNTTEFEPHDDWHESTIESFTDALELVVFMMSKLGLVVLVAQVMLVPTFTGKYTYTKGALAKVKKEFPKWSELHQFAQELQELQRKCFYSMYMRITHSGITNMKTAQVLIFRTTGINTGIVQVILTKMSGKNVAVHSCSIFTAS